MLRNLGLGARRHVPAVLQRQAAQPLFHHHRANIADLQILPARPYPALQEAPVDLLGVVGLFVFLKLGGFQSQFFLFVIINEIAHGDRSCCRPAVLEVDIKAQCGGSRLRGGCRGVLLHAANNPVLALALSIGTAFIPTKNPDRRSVPALFSLQRTLLKTCPSKHKFPPRLNGTDGVRSLTSIRPSNARGLVALQLAIFSSQRLSAERRKRHNLPIWIATTSPRRAIFCKVFG